VFSTIITDKSGPVQSLPHVLQVGPLPATAIGPLGEHFVLSTIDSAGWRAVAPSIRGIATNGKTPIGSELLDQLPGLAIVSCLGAGTDGLDVDLLGARGITVATTSSVLADDVADVAMGLVVALARDIRRADRFVRAGRWADGKYPLGTSLPGAHLGILGLGAIGSAVARRAAAFGMRVGYHNRRPRPGVELTYFSSPVELAAWSRFLVVTCPGGPATHHLVDAPVLAALGPESWLVNVARGSVVNEEALIAALAAGEIAGAGLDVFEGEPAPDSRLLAQDNTILLPHIGSATAQTRDAMARAMVEALRQHLLGR
jgi:lactate dehydrogenase-like 2-hydroxyacid dehydrogenase